MEKTSPPAEVDMEKKSPPADKEPKEKHKVSPIVWIGLAVLVLTVLVLVGLFLLSDHNLTRVRDVAIAFLAILFFVSIMLIIFLLGVIIWAIGRLSEKVSTLTEQVGGVVGQVQETATTVRGTAGFVGERVSSPFIRVSAWASGVGKGVATFFKTRTGKEKVDE
jgi:ABC-type multidrug transport system fused ATPase/permease subunit